MFISFEGTDGAGKTVQIKLFKEYLEQHFDKEVVLVRDPGSTPISEKLRDIVLDINNKEMGYRCEALIYSASRAQMVHEIIKPSLENNKFVLSDRFIDSSLVYQGVSRGLPLEDIYSINKFAVENIFPSLTFFLDIDVETSISRKNQMKELDRIEVENMSFHEKVRKGYLEISKNEPNRLKVINASKTIEEVHKSIVDTFTNFINTENL